MIVFEFCKRVVVLDRINLLNIILFFFFIDYYKKFCGYSVEYVLWKSNVDFVKWFLQGMLWMSLDVMNVFFKLIIDSIIEYFWDLFQKFEVFIVKFFFLVGGFVEVFFLQQVVQVVFGDQCWIIIFQDVGFIIFKGVVFFGLDFVVIKVCWLLFIYGVGVLNCYVEGKYLFEKLLVKDGIWWCIDVFDKFIFVDQFVVLGELVKCSYILVKFFQLVIVINIYSLEYDDVSFIIDFGVKKCGMFCLDFIGISGIVVFVWREIQIFMQFGDIEIKVIVIDIVILKSVKVGIDFLNY